MQYRRPDYWDAQVACGVRYYQILVDTIRYYWILPDIGGNYEIRLDITRY